MNQWRILNKNSLQKKFQPFLSKLAHIHPKAEIYGRVYISENTNVGHSKLLAEKDFYINIGKDTTIKDHVFITAIDSKLDPNNSEVNQVKDVSIGNKVFISSEVSIHGPTIIFDGTFIGNNTTIVNSKIGANCIIEDRVVIKNIDIPPDTFIPNRSFIDSVQKLNEIILITNQGNYCEYDILKKNITSGFAKAG